MRLPRLNRKSVTFLLRKRTTNTTPQKSRPVLQDMGKANSFLKERFLKILLSFLLSLLAFLSWSNIVFSITVHLWPWMLLPPATRHIFPAQSKVSQADRTAVSPKLASEGSTVCKSVLGQTLGSQHLPWSSSSSHLTCQSKLISAHIMKTQAKIFWILFQSIWRFQTGILLS